MKLRIGGNSIRLRVLRSEVETLRTGGRLTETLYFGDGDDAKFTYAVGSADAPATTVHFANCRVLVLLSAARVQQWANSEEVGIYEQLPAGEGRTLDVLVEKDFACLDRSDADNADTFSNPNATC